MRTARQQEFMKYMIMAMVAVVVLGSGWATAAYDRDNQQQYQSQQQYQDQDQGDQSYQPPSRTAQMQGRDMRLEQQIASRLRQQGYGTQGEIMILATGNRVILLGTVPDNRTKDGVEKAAKQFATRQSIDNRLHVRTQARRVSDDQLAKDTNDKLSDELSENVQVQARNGTVTLQGQLDNWRQVADAIDAAFAAGATQVNSQFSVAGATGMARGGAGGTYPSYGYAPDQQGQYGRQQGSQGERSSMGGMTRASTSDLRLAQQVASQLRQQLPAGQNVQPVQPQSIYVTAQRGTVTLHGYVQSSNQKQQAEQIVQSIQGVQTVRNDLTILSTRGGTGPAGGQGGFSGQGYGGTSDQSGSYPPQGYISPSPGDQSRQDFGSASDQSQYGQSSQSGSGQDFGSATDQSQYGQSSQSGSQQSAGGMAGQSQFGQSGRMGSPQAGGAMSPTDTALAQRVAQQLKQRLPSIQNIQAMRPGTIYVMAAQGTVMLHGIVQNNNISQQASQIARSVPGVRNLQSTLRAGRAAGGYPSYGYIPGQEQQGQQGAAGQGMQSESQGMQGQNQGTQGSAQMRQIAQSGQTAPGQSSQSDLTIARRVALQLLQQLPSFYNVQIATPGTIYVKVSNGTVTLDGFVSSNDAKRNAEQIAKSISGVQNVKNSLSIVGINQTLGYMPADEDQSAYQDQPLDERQSEDQMGNREFDKGQAGEEQPDEGTN
jgi:osmotically-inducible protein OsmY